jgi:hypothetical protein
MVAPTRSHHRIRWCEYIYSWTKEALINNDDIIKHRVNILQIGSTFYK